MSLSALLLLAAVGLFVCALLVTAGVLTGVSNASFVDAGLACFAASFLPFRSRV